MRRNQRETGTRYERLAAEYLEQNGYTIVERNFRCPFGEIDLIALDGDTLVFCEVKYRATVALGHPLEAISKKKQRTISKCALYYVSLRGLTEVSSRFDVIGILGEELTVVKNAFYYMR